MEESVDLSHDAVDASIALAAAEAAAAAQEQEDQEAAAVAAAAAAAAVIGADNNHQEEEEEPPQNDHELIPPPPDDDVLVDDDQDVVVHAQEDDQPPQHVVEQDDPQHLHELHQQEDQGVIVAAQDHHHYDLQNHAEPSPGEPFTHLTYHSQPQEEQQPPPQPQPPQPEDEQQQQEEEEEEEDHHELPKVCRICGKGPQDDGRPLCRFVPVEVDAATAAAAPHTITFSQDIYLHVFCGKTASILPNVNQPELEILSKAGIKNKHGIGPDVNGALARTRSSVVREGQRSTKEKTFYLVKEFEAHLAAVRNASSHHHHQQQQQQHHAGYVGALHHHHLPPPHHHHHHLTHHHVGVVPNAQAPAGTGFGFAEAAAPDMYGATAATTTASPSPPPIVQQHLQQQQPPSTTITTTTKQIPHKAGTTYQKRDPWALPANTASCNTSSTVAQELVVTPDGKIRCGCGGTHLPTGTPKGDASWRAHVMTKRHQKWMEDNGMLGAV